jgi:hypothetical protein
MEIISPADLYFSNANPPAIDLPHLLAALDAELLGEVAHLTKSRIGIWQLPAPYDDTDQFDNTRETAPLSAWGLPLNQGEILSFSSFVQETVFGSKCMFVDAASDETVLTRLAIPAGARLESGAWVTQGYEDLPQIREVLECCAWALIPVGPERSRALFVTRPAGAPWVTDLSEWCERDGRNRGHFRRAMGRIEWVDRFAPEQNRSNAIGHQIDLFLGRIETYFGRAETSLAPALLERMEARRQLRQDVARARQ